MLVNSFNGDRDGQRGKPDLFRNALKSDATSPALLFWASLLDADADFTIFNETQSQ